MLRPARIKLFFSISKFKMLVFRKKSGGGGGWDGVKNCLKIAVSLKRRNQLKCLRHIF